MKILITIALAWYMILRVANGSVTIGPFEDAESCKEQLAVYQGHLANAGINLIASGCFYRANI